MISIARSPTLSIRESFNYTPEADGISIATRSRGIVVLFTLTPLIPPFCSTPEAQIHRN